MSSKYQANMHCWNYSESYIRFQFTETLRKLFIMSPHCWIHIGFPLTGDMTESIWDYTIVSTLLKLYSKFPYIFRSVTVFFIQCEELDIKNHILRGFFHSNNDLTVYEHVNLMILSRRLKIRMNHKILQN